MVNRLVSVGDDFTLPAAVKAADANLPTHAKAATLTASFGAKLDKTEAATTYAKVTVPGLSFPEKLDRWYEKVMKAHRTQTSIAFFGHSIVSGSYANNDGTFTTDTEATRYYSLAPQLAANFARKFGDAGVGFLWAADLPGLSYTLAGGAAKSQSSSSQGYGHYRFTIPTGGTVSISGVKATKIKLHYLGNQPAASVTVDGGAPVTLPQAADADGLYTVTIPDLADKAHTVVVSGPSTGTCYLTGVEFLRTDTGIPVHRFGWSGKVAADAFGWAAPAGTTLGDLSTAAKDRQIQSVTTRLNVGLAVIMFDANDVNLGYPIYGLTPTTLQTQIQQLVDKIKLLSPNTDILLVTGPQKDPASFTQPYTQAQFAQAYYNVAAATANVAHLDLLALWGTYAEANAKGLYYDTIHPNLKGHADLGNTIYRALTPRSFHLPNF